MIDFFKDASDAWFQRIRSPILGSIILAFVLLNWQPIWYLLFADRPVAVKFNYVSINSSIWTLYFGPVFVGLLIAVITPWIRLGGAWIAIKPISLLRKLEYDQVHDQKLHRLRKEAEEETAQAKFEEARERRAIEAAKRLQEASELKGETAVEELNEQRAQDQSKFSLEDTISRLNRFDLAALELLGSQSEELSIGQIAQAGDSHFFLEQHIPNASTVRIQAELEGSFAKFESEDLADRSASNRWKLTQAGYEIYDAIMERADSRS